MSESRKVDEGLSGKTAHDNLTRVPDRSLLRTRMQRAVVAARRRDASLALLLMDLDRFKEINHTFGHRYGDLLLHQVDRRLREKLTDIGTVARLGGDEFAILLPAVIDGREAMRVASKLLRILAQPFWVGAHLFTVEASIGIALAPQHGEDADTLLRHADIAMYVAKRADSGPVLYATDQDQYSPDRLTLLGDLRSAIEHDQLSLHYQPKVKLSSGSVTGVEALLRWQHAEHGFIPPGEFIPLAENTGLVKRLTRWVLSAALHQMELWKHDGWEIPVAINLSARNLHDLHLVSRIPALLRSHQIEAGMLTLEITESAIMANADRALKILTRLHEHGVRISIDDFGTGYSSLAYLRRLPVDEIKIDRSFVQGIVRNDDDAIIVRSIVDLGHNLHHELVAEGVEDEETWNRLAAMGCDLVQGYYVTRPVPAVDLLTRLSKPPADAETIEGPFRLHVVPPSGQGHVYRIAT